MAFDKSSSIVKILLLGFVFLNIQTLFADGKNISYKNGNFELKFDNLQFSVLEYDKAASQPRTLFNTAPLSIIQYKAGNKIENLNNAVLTGHKTISNKDGKVFQARFSGSNSSLVLKVEFTFPSKYKNVIIYKASLLNKTGGDVELLTNVLANFVVDAKNYGADSSYKFWSFQGESSGYRLDWIMPVTKTFGRENYQGMNAPDYGGSIPMVDLWAKKCGVAVASLSMQPELISFPVRVLSDNNVSLQIKDSVKNIIKANSEKTFPEFAIITHTGDYFNPMALYSLMMQKRGLTFGKAPKSALEPEWCAWGYMRDFNKNQIIATLKTVKDIGFKWVTIDDGWQNFDGDWQIDKNKFPGGEKEFKALIDTIHSMGFKVRLWWVPYETHDSSYNPSHYPQRLKEYGMKFQSQIALSKPEWFILDKNQNRVQVSWWNSYLMCPALDEVKDHFKKFVTKAITEWKLDGFKIDGQNMNAVPQCYNPLHKHKLPEDACTAVPGFFKVVYETALKLKPDFVVQLCPCGCDFSLYNLPYTNQTVGSDPESPFQVRSKGKTFKALFGNIGSYSGDHVELTARKWNPETQKTDIFQSEDFASTIAVGGVPASKFTSPAVAQVDTTLMLTAEKEQYWKKWIGIYNYEKMSEGEYKNLYDIAFDIPETHVIKKGKTFYYSMFYKGHFSGEVEFRGLDEKNYKLVDVVNGKSFGTVSRKNPKAVVSFDSYIILKTE